MSVQQSLRYKAHTQAEYNEIVRALARMSAKTLKCEPDKIILGPCIALVNVMIVDVTYDRAGLTIDLTFVESPTVPAT